jgi:hypothetical protein
MQRKLNLSFFQIPLRETLGLDIADRLRSHFLSSLPTQTYSWNAGNNSQNTQNSGIIQNGQFRFPS